jgi:hypothetical protein
MNTTQHGAMPGQATSYEKAPGACTTEGLNTDATNDLNFATGQRHRKRIATQIAELALGGHAVHELRCADFLVCKYGYTHYAQDLEALQAFARRLGVSK